ncbi:MAG: threonylcarbamoyl-AMP synthase [Geminicoccaceae bacterium]|nr:threonylcarbamoyl-AMP synthase [Geminicoccaceae bacterium]
MRPVSPDEAGLARAARALQAGGLVAFPTETVYGLGAAVTDGGAVARVYAAKGRPAHNPLIVHVASLEAARRLGAFDGRAELLAEAFWPGPLTLVLPQRRPNRLSALATAGLDTVALRFPGHPVARALLAAAGLPVAAPSANPSGQTSPTTAAHVLADLGDALDPLRDLVVDGGDCPLGVESTVVDLSSPDRARLLRPGGLPRAVLGGLIGPLLGPEAEAPLRSPGLLGRHYAPRLPIRLDACEVGPDEALLAFGPDPLMGARIVLNLSVDGRLDEAARNLYAHLRRLDASDAAAIAVMPIPEEGLGEAIADRLRRAAA